MPGAHGTDRASALGLLLAPLLSQQLPGGCPRLRTGLALIEQRKDSRSRSCYCFCFCCCYIAIATTTAVSPLLLCATAPAIINSPVPARHFTFPFLFRLPPHAPPRHHRTPTPTRPADRMGSRPALLHTARIFPSPPPPHPPLRLSFSILVPRQPPLPSPSFLLPRHSDYPLRTSSIPPHLLHPPDPHTLLAPGSAHPCLGR